MMLNNFYFIDDLLVDQNVCSAKIRIAADHEILKAHFPEQAVVPGVCMMEMIKDVLAQVKQQNIHLKESSVVKFLHLWTPEQTKEVVIHLSWKESNSQFTCDAQISFQDIVFMKFKGVYQ